MIPVLQTVAGLALLCVGGEFLIRGATGLATRMGVSALAIGLTVVAFGTSTPELVVSLDAAISGANDIAVGNVVGSNIANIALILGLAVVIAPTVIAAKLARIDGPIMVLASLALLAILANGTASRIEGLLLAVALLGYIAFTFRQARYETAAVRSEFADVAPRKAVAGATTASLLVVIGLALLVGGGHLLVSAAVVMATQFGLSQAAIGLTIVAVGTSLPELATSTVAAVRGQGDIALGNVVGSNVFNILGILGITAVVEPLSLGNITWFDLSLMTVLAIALAVRIRTTDRIGRIDGAILLAAFAAYTTYLLAG